MANAAALACLRASKGPPELGGGHPTFTRLGGAPVDLQGGYLLGEVARLLGGGLLRTLQDRHYISGTGPSHDGGMRTVEARSNRQMAENRLSELPWGQRTGPAAGRVNF